MTAGNTEENCLAIHTHGSNRHCLALFWYAGLSLRDNPPFSSCAQKF